MGLLEAFFGIVLTIVLAPFILAAIGVVLYLVFVVWLFVVCWPLGFVVVGGTVWLAVWWDRRGRSQGG